MAGEMLAMNIAQIPFNACRTWAANRARPGVHRGQKPWYGSTAFGPWAYLHEKSATDKAWQRKCPKVRRQILDEAIVMMKSTCEFLMGPAGLQELISIFCENHSIRYPDGRWFFGITSAAHTSNVDQLLWRFDHWER